MQREAVPHEPGELDRLASRAPETQAAGADAGLEAEQRILRALEGLPPLYGAALILSRRDGLSYTQIGRELGISAHTVRKYLTRAVAHLKTSRQDE
jgi:RNA polymerase sigma factor (sigma-70 family)